MKKYITTNIKLGALALSFFLLCNTVNAQYVTIPDANFVNWLDTSGYAGCLNGNQLDTTCAAVLNAISLSCHAVPIHDLTGVQYFKNLDTLDCSNDSLYLIPSLPAALVSLNCGLNNLSSLPALPGTLVSLDCIFNQLTALPALPASLQNLTCDANQLSSLPALPSQLSTLECNHNQLGSLPTLPAALYEFGCIENQITSFPALPGGLYGLYCDSNQLSVLPSLPSTLGVLFCRFNQLASLPVLPSSLATLYCDGNHISNLAALPPALGDLGCGQNQLTSLPSLPATLTFLGCAGNQLTSLPALPGGLQNLACYDNQLTSLPALPLSLQDLACRSNQLTSLPALPPGLTDLQCEFNQLTSIPTLPDSLTFFSCNNNPNLSCLPELKKIGYLFFDSTAITCLPNYGTISGYSVPPLNSVPLCGIFNPNGCQPYWNISGQVYYDANADCVFDSTDVGQGYVKMQLNSAGFQQQVYSSLDGFYSFQASQNINYTVQPDASSLPFIISCPGVGYIHTSLSAIDSLSYDNNFALKCRTDGIDVGIQSIIDFTKYTVPRPATPFTLFTIAGDISDLYGAHCAAGTSGQVQLIYTGEVTYQGVDYGALTPASVNGDTITWNIPDFGTVDDYSAFNTLFIIDTNAAAGTQVCFTVHVTPTAGDYNTANNTGYFCFTIVDALDPNEKEVSPAGNLDTAQHWLTYTIRFQNTGSAPAQNIRLTDTLDSHLDPSTFQLLAYSAKNLTQVFDNVVVFNFPNINLPDSATSDSASRGYVQYKIKLLDNLPVGTQIQNTANIYFDLNPAVVTNTTSNFIGDSISAISALNDQPLFALYPNPAKNYVIVETGPGALGSLLELTDLTGREVFKTQVTSSKFKIVTDAFSGGVYFVKINTVGANSVVKKLVIE